ncbi:hypothetical protein XENORESO_009205 [Xenotaenia resolanae]|uniref:Secreted protein n=1 Tax=Xenotaenia resolanae TaxID=208358 RepID=A0ABV0X7R3_9TELE
MLNVVVGFILLLPNSPCILDHTGPTGPELTQLNIRLLYHLLSHEQSRLSFRCYHIFLKCDTMLQLGSGAPSKHLFLILTLFNSQSRSAEDLRDSSVSPASSLLPEGRCS